MIDPKNPRHLFNDGPRPCVILDKDQTLALLRDPAACAAFMESRDHWEYKSQYLCDFMRTSITLARFIEETPV